MLGKQWWPAVAGGAALVVGGWKVWFSAPGTATTALLVIGGLLLVSPLLIARLERLSVRADGFDLQLSRDIAAQGAEGVARLLDHTELGRLAEAYGVIRAEFPDDAEQPLRKKVQDGLVSRAARFATQHKFDADEVNRLYPNAAPVTRVLLLGLMDGDPTLARPGTLAEAIERPSTANEQYHALKLAAKYLPRLDGTEQARLRTTVGRADLGPAHSDRRRLANQIAGRRDQPAHANS